MVGLLLTGAAFILFVKGRYVASLLIFFGLLTNGYQVIPSFVLMMGFGGAKSTDLALLYVLAVVGYRFGTFRRIVTREAPFGWVVVFLGFVGLDALYSLLILEYGLGGIVKVIRTYLFLLGFGVFFLVPLPLLKRVMNILAAITVAQCVLYLIQIPTGLTTLSSGSAGGDAIVGQFFDTGLSRYLNTPVYLTPVLFYYLFAYRFRSFSAKAYVLGTLVVTTIVPLSRAYLLLLFTVLVVHTLVTQTSTRRLVYSAGLSLCAYAAMLVDAVNNRINQAMTDLAKTFSGSMTRIDQLENTFSFRLAHLTERFDYIMTIPAGWLMGLGLLHEETPQAARLPFQVALFNERLGRTVQIDTGDIVWSILFLQLGLVGTILYVSVFVRFGWFAYLRRRLTPYSTVVLLWVTMMLLGSMTGVDLILTPLRIMVLFMMVLIAKDATQPKPTPPVPPDPGKRVSPEPVPVWAQVS